MNLKELARTLGLSPTTVSRALNGYPEVGAATRARILDAARRHNYAPNLRARSLATGRSMAIGHVIPATTRHEMVNPVFGDFIAGAGEAYASAGYDMVLSMVEDAQEARVYHDLKARAAVDGLIVHGPGVDDRRPALLRRIGLPFLVHGRVSTDPGPYSWLDIDNTDAFRRATDLLLDLGHCRIALVNGLEAMDYAHRRRAGFVAALAARDLAPDPALMRSDEMTEPYGHDAAAQMLALPDPPTAFLCGSMLVGIGVRRALEDRGLRMGRDASVLIHDDMLSYLRNGTTRDGAPVFTATRSSVWEAGRRSAELLLRIIADPGMSPLSERLVADLVPGSSTGPAPSPAM